MLLCISVLLSAVHYFKWVIPKPLTLLSTLSLQHYSIIRCCFAFTSIFLPDPWFCLFKVFFQITSKKVNDLFAKVQSVVAPDSTKVASTTVFTIRNAKFRDTHTSTGANARTQHDAHTATRTEWKVAQPREPQHCNSLIGQYCLTPQPWLVNMQTTRNSLASKQRCIHKWIQWTDGTKYASKSLCLEEARAEYSWGPIGEPIQPKPAKTTKPKVDKSLTKSKNKNAIVLPNIFMPNTVDTNCGEHN